MTDLQIKSNIGLILNQEGIKDHVIKVIGKSENGDGYTGQVWFIEAEGKLNGKETKLNLAAKVLKTGILKAMPNVISGYKNEEHIYAKVFPTIQALEEKYNIKDPFKNYARYYGSCDNSSMLVFENLKSSNYELHNIKNQMNLYHVKMVLEAYAKLHAFSFSYRDQDPEGFEKLSEMLTEIMEDFLETGFDIFENVWKDACQDLEQKGETELAEKYKGINLKDTILLSIQPEEKSVICHGDAWNNNFLFKYNSEDKIIPMDFVILDWQVCHLQSPVVDLSHFLFCNMDQEGYDKFDELLDFYYDNLAKNIRNFGSNPEKLFSRSDFDKHWLKYGKFGLAFAPVLYSISDVDKKDMPDVDKGLEEGKTFSEAFSLNLTNNENFNKKLIRLLKFCISRKFI